MKWRRKKQEEDINFHMSTQTVGEQWVVVTKLRELR